MKLSIPKSCGLCLTFKIISFQVNKGKARHRLTWPSDPVNSVSIASRVVPLTGLTIVLSSPTKAFKILLLPTFGRPTMAIAGT